MSHNVFISYKAEEFEEANWVKTVLEQNGISCWMAPMSIKGGSSYASEIPQAIRECKVFVLILSKKAQESKWVPREIDQAINENKIILPFMLENCSLKDDFNFYLSNVQRYTAYENKSNAIEKMLNEIKAVLGISDEEETEFNNAEIQQASSDNEKEKYPDNNLPQKQDKPKKKNKKHNKKRTVIITVILLFIIVTPMIALMCNNHTKTVTIGGEEFKANTSSIRFDENGKELSSEDVDKIKALSELSSLDLDNCTLPEGAVGEFMQMNLYSLSLSGCGITDSDFENLSVNGSIVSLNLNDNDITDISALTSLSEKLSKLYIDNNPVSDVSVLNSFHLKTVSIKNIGLKDVSSLASLSDLQELYIDGNSIETLEPLAGCEKLNVVSVSNNNISNFKGLEHALNLSEIYAEANQVTSLEGLENATVLVSVNLNDNSVNDISSLAKSKETLTNLYVDNNDITDINPLKECINIKVLHINDNSINSLKALSACVNIEKLSAENNNLTSAAGLENAVNLNFIDLSDNNIGDTSALINVVQNGYIRVYLDLSNNVINSLKIPNVEYSFFNLSGNNIDDISSLSKVKISEFIFDYSEKEDYSSFSDNTFYHIYIVDCPLDRQLELKKVFGEYNTNFISADEIDDIDIG